MISNLPMTCGGSSADRPAPLAGAEALSGSVWADGSNGSGTGLDTVPPTRKDTRCLALRSGNLPGASSLKLVNAHRLCISEVQAQNKRHPAFSDVSQHRVGGLSDGGRRDLDVWV